MNRLVSAGKHCIVLEIYLLLFHSLNKTVMRKIIFQGTLIAFAIMISYCITTFAQQKTASKSKPTEHWIKVYRDVIMGDQSNTTYGPFLQTSNGKVISLEDAARLQKEIALVFFTEYDANYATLTFPGNATAAASYGTDNIAAFTENPGGMNHWDQQNLNSGLITSATNSSGDMAAADFNAVASSNDWNTFSKMFRQFNSGSSKLSYTNNYIHVEGNTVYMFQVNNAIRGFIYIKNLAPKSAKGGSIKFDLIVEGGDEFKSSDANVLQPSKD
jgi:hypothetical protein